MFGFEPIFSNQSTASEPNANARSHHRQPTKTCCQRQFSANPAFVEHNLYVCLHYLLGGEFVPISDSFPLYDSKNLPCVLASPIRSARALGAYAETTALSPYRDIQTEAGFAFMLRQPSMALVFDEMRRAGIVGCPRQQTFPKSVRKDDRRPPISRRAVETAAERAALFNHSARTKRQIAPKCSSFVPHPMVVCQDYATLTRDRRPNGQTG